MSHPIHATHAKHEHNTDQTFTRMLHALIKRQAFPFAYAHGEDPYIIQTHASAVILTPAYVYKLKKPRNFGFFDYSTIALRRHFCQMEVILNDPLAPDIYLGVAPVVESSGGSFSFGHTYPPGNVPLPGGLDRAGTLVDYAVVMRRLPESATLYALLHAGNVSPDLMSEIAQTVAHFHTQTQTNDHVASFGCMDVIRKNWDENFQQMRPYIGRTIQKDVYTALQRYVHQFLKQHEALFQQRITHDHIRDCHGDLRLQHVYVLPALDSATKQRIILLDRIEFNERLRYGDVASEVAFLCMELDFAKRPNLSQAFLTRYIEETGDRSLPTLLPFYSCYRACVRGKVASLLLDDTEVTKAQQAQATQEAIDMFTLALHYTHATQHPLLIMVGGVMGTGKSTIACEIQHKYHYPLLSTDSIRKELARLQPMQPQAEQFGAGIYDPAWTRKTYAALNDRAQAYLQQGYSVILDGTFASRADRQKIAHVAAQHGATALFIECVAPREITLQRLAQRWQARTATSVATHEGLSGISIADMASMASDGRPELYDAQLAHWEAYDPEQEREVRHIVLPTMAASQETMATLQRDIGQFRNEVGRGKAISQK